MDPLKLESDDDKLLEIMDERSAAIQGELHEHGSISIKSEETSTKLNGQTVAYRFIMPNNVVEGKQANSMANMSQQIYFISSEPGNADTVVLNNATISSGIVTPIAPKLITGRTVQRILPAAAIPARKRDDRRRATHNEVERRRRDKINHWIMKLGNIIPADGIPGGALDRPNVTNADGQSKGGILSQACEYVTALHSKVNDLTECLKEMERLRDSNDQLQAENQQFRTILLKNGLLPADCDDPLMVLT